MLPRFPVFHDEELTKGLTINSIFSIIYSLIISSVLIILNCQLIVSV